MNGADALIRTFAECGVRTCFANPGTSEMHLVAALDREPRIRSILCLFEGVATGAADGYARMTGRPAMTLL
ncbi:MAG TPA: thiamine pyrophosphate-binding protein, partial [Steroidobacteraceae bacterium]|nr:thiamine pyrophosphate-binding protein [Steroidobacteraceae bacterium]